MDYLLVLGANQFQRERGLAGAEKSYDGPVVICSNQQIQNPNNFASFIIPTKSETNPEELISAVKNFNLKMNAKPIAVVPLNDFVLNSSARVATEYSLNTNGFDVIENCRNKELMKSKLESKGLPISKSYRFESKDEAILFSKKLDFPLVVKPLDFGGSGGVKRVNNPDELAFGIDETLAHLNKYASLYNSKPNSFIIEKYINISTEISVEVLNSPLKRKVLGITHKYLSPEPYFAEIGHFVPSPLTFISDLKEKIHHYALAACEALEIKYGIAHVEMKVSLSGKIIIIEVGARTAGDGIMDLWEKSTGVSFYKLHCDSYLGIFNEISEIKPLRSAAVGYFCPCAGEIIGLSENLQELSENLAYIEKINVRSSIGQFVTEIKDWSTRFGFVNYLFSDVLTDINMFDLPKETQQLTDSIFQIKGGK